ncbi:MAG: hypothetical protein ACM3S1_11385 [Hyphomicrobiales bacterium]
MNDQKSIPGSISVYELIRMRPAASVQLARMGVTREFYDYRLIDAAIALGLPVERLTEAGAPVEAHS